MTRNIAFCRVNDLFAPPIIVKLQFKDTCRLMQRDRRRGAEKEEEEAEQRRKERGR